MKEKIKIIVLILFLAVIFNLIFSIVIQNRVNATQNVSTKIEEINDLKYPGIKDRIKLLQTKYPDWEFKILYTGLDWNEVITNEYVGHNESPKNLVYKSLNYKGAWICQICKDKEYDNGNWRCASEQAIKYMIDPRNSINASDIFQFEELTNNESDINFLKTMTKGTFLEEHEQQIIDVSNKNKVSPYYIVARLIQEQGSEGTVLTSGLGYNDNFKGYYNAFNVAASGNTTEEILINALTYAKKKGWDTLEKSIEGGISFIANQYINNGQNTLYFQKFDVIEKNGFYSNQYMQNIMAAQTEGMSLRDAYINIKTVESKHTFIIPVYENMPQDACIRPDPNGTSDIKSDIVKVNVETSLKIRNNPNGDKTLGYLYKNEIVTRLEKATSKVNNTYWDKVQKDNGIIGYVARETYDNENEYKLYLVSVDENSSDNNSNNSTQEEIIKGDIDSNQNIDAMDMYKIIQYILGNLEFSNNQLKAADINDDGKIDAMDMYLIIQKIKNS